MLLGLVISHVEQYGKTNVAFVNLFLKLAINRLENMRVGGIAQSHTRFLEGEDDMSSHVLLHVLHFLH